MEIDVSVFRCFNSIKHSITIKDIAISIEVLAAFAIILFLKYEVSVL